MNLQSASSDKLWEDEFITTEPNSTSSGEERWHKGRGARRWEGAAAAALTLPVHPPGTCVRVLHFTPGHETSASGRGIPGAHTWEAEQFSQC